MKYVLSISLFLLYVASQAQERVNPVVKNFGGIYQIPEATVRPDPEQEYKIVIDVFGGTDDKKEVDHSLNNVARMLNLHSSGGVPSENMKIVLALHGQSTYSTLDNKTYKKEFGITNPNADLIKELKEAGVKITVCGQSLRARGFEGDLLNGEVEIAVSMLTTVTHYQNLGYMMLRF